MVAEVTTMAGAGDATAAIVKFTHHAQGAASVGGLFRFKARTEVAGTKDESGDY